MAIVIVSTLIIVVRGTVAVGRVLFAGAGFGLHLEIFLCDFGFAFYGVLLVGGEIDDRTTCVTGGVLTLGFGFVFLFAEEQRSTFPALFRVVCVALGSCGILFGTLIANRRDRRRRDTFLQRDPADSWSKVALGYDFFEVPRQFRLIQ